MSFRANAKLEHLSRSQKIVQLALKKSNDNDTNILNNELHVQIEKNSDIHKYDSVYINAFKTSATLTENTMPFNIQEKDNIISNLDVHKDLVIPESGDIDIIKQITNADILFIDEFDDIIQYDKTLLQQRSDIPECNNSKATITNAIIIRNSPYFNIIEQDKTDVEFQQQLDAPDECNIDYNNDYRIDPDDFNQDLDIPENNNDPDDFNQDLDIPENNNDPDDFNQYLNIPENNNDPDDFNQDLDIPENNNDPDYFNQDLDIPENNYDHYVDDIQHEDLEYMEESGDENNSQLANIKRNRAKKSDSSLWQRNINKSRRMHGENYKGYERSSADGKITVGIERKCRNLSVKSASNACIKSKKRHCQTFSEEDRLSIFNTFWKTLSWEEKKIYATSNIVPKMVASSNNSRRQGTYKYYLRTKKNDKLQVCKKMYLGTLGLREDMIHDWAKNLEHGLRVETTDTENPVQRLNARQTLAKQKKDLIIEFFESLPKLPSHYCRRETTKLYLEQFFQTKVDLFKEYCQFLEGQEKTGLIVSRPIFDQVFSESNIALYQPRKDRCDICCGYETQNITEEEYRLHIIKKDRARVEKNNDKAAAVRGENYTFTMDIQAVKICPVLNASALYYKTKLSVHNFTMYNLASHDSTNYWWNESEGDLSASTFATFIINYLKEKCVNKDIPIILYSDGCCYQNRNCILANALLNYSINNGVTIIQKYLEKGHTQMECDSVHAMIERKLNRRQIHLPSDYLKITEESRRNPRPLEAISVSYSYFTDYNNRKTFIYSSIRPGRSTSDPTVTNLRYLKYNPVKKVIEYKLNFDDESKELPVRAVYPKHVEYKQLHNERLKIPQKKWQHLQELKKVLPSDCHNFYDNL